MFWKSMLFLFVLAVILLAPVQLLARQDVLVYFTQQSAIGERFYVADPNDPVNVYVDGCQVSYEIPALVFHDRYLQGRTMVPLRTTVEFIGATVTWHEDTRSILVVHEGKTVFLTVDKHWGEANGKTFTLDIAPAIVSGRTLIPLRFFSEALGFYVYWDGANRSVYINTSGKKFPLGKRSGIYRHFDGLMRQEAVLYGKAHRYRGLDTFYREWTVPAENAANDGIFARVETPFLAVAQAARIAAKSDCSLTSQGIWEMIEDHKEKIPFYVYLQGSKLDFARRYTAYLEQGGRKTTPRERIIEDEVYQKEYFGEDQYRAVIKFIFDADDFITSKPVVLVVEGEDDRQWRFNFDLPNIR
ncbi:MAG: copper amine oxidase N-terminal domain-containing protein [Thermoanaerobacteraceae bacterium]|nr:copper amine oxidase N-terminal domain-containing protein [Thermoanaerobacteraceae bacterium]